MNSRSTFPRRGAEKRPGGVTLWEKEFPPGLEGEAVVVPLYTNGIQKGGGWQQLQPIATLSMLMLA